MQKTVKVILCDDHDIVREGLISMLKTDPKIKVIGEVGNGKILLELIKKNKPDIVLLDVEMPVMGGEEALSVITRRFPDVKVIVLSMHYSNALVTDFLSKGAAAYLPKNVNAKTLLKAIYSVQETGEYLDSECAQALLHTLKREKNLQASSSKASLSQREEEITRLIILGKKSKEIGNELYISTRTVTFHRENISKKIRAKSVTDLVIYAIKNGILDINEAYSNSFGR
jgi:DNA-binding NarL/FixJ family response regulator